MKKICETVTVRSISKYTGVDIRFFENLEET